MRERDGYQGFCEIANKPVRILADIEVQSYCLITFSV